MASLSEVIAEQQRRERRARAILAAAIRADGNENKTRTRIYKVFWTAHLQHMSVHGVRLSSWPIVRLPRGPAPNDGKILLEQLELDGLIKQQPEVRFGHMARGATVANRAKLDAFIAEELSPQEVESIEAMATFLENATATDVSNWSHEVSRAWKEAGKDGQPLEVYLDLVTDDEEYEELQNSLDAGKALADEVFGNKRKG